MEKRCCGCMQIKTQSPLCELCGYNENIDNLPHQLPVDTVLNGRYRLGKVLGQGGFGITYIGWDEKEDVAVAVKEYYPKNVVDRDVTVSKDVVCREESGQNFFRQYREQFLQEAKMLEKFANVPQIVHVKTVFEENNTVYIAMEHVRGTDLRMYLRMAGLLSVQQTFYIFRPVIEALIQVHKSGLVHKDISPDNIMILPNGQAKLLDFGAAQDIMRGVRNEETSQSTITVVKHGFAPPEQYQMDSDLGPWTDVYALCATIYYCMTGKIPKPSPERIKDRALNWDDVPELTPAQIAALERGMEPMPADRFHDVGELYSALFPPKLEKVTKLEEITDEGKPTRKRPAKKKKEPKPPKEKKPADPARKKNLLIAAACVVILAAAAVFLMLPRGWAEEDGITCYYKVGSKVTGLQQIDGKTYLFDGDGAMVTGWQEIDDGLCCFGSDGGMLTGVQTIDGMEYHFDEKGNFRYRIRSLSREELMTAESEDKVGFQKKNGGTQSWTYRLLEQPVENCTGFSAKMKLTEYKSGNVEQWEFAYRDLNGQWHTLREAFGLKNDKAELEWSMEDPISFDAYVWYCVSIGNMWNFERSYEITEATVIDYEIDS